MIAGARTGGREGFAGAKRLPAPGFGTKRRLRPKRRFRPGGAPGARRGPQKQMWALYIPSNATLPVYPCRRFAGAAFGSFARAKGWTVRARRMIEALNMPGLCTWRTHRRLGSLWCSAQLGYKRLCTDGLHAPARARVAARAPRGLEERGWRSGSESTRGRQQNVRWVWPVGRSGHRKAGTGPYTEWARTGRAGCRCMCRQRRGGRPTRV